MSNQPSRRLSNEQSSCSSVEGIGGGNNNKWGRIRSSRREESIIHEKALAAALLLQQQLQSNGGGGGGGGGGPFDRSTSLKNSYGSSKKYQPLPRTSSNRPRSLTDPLLHPHQLVNKLTLDGLETNHFVLVHGGGFGAWCWYKSIALLEDAGFKVTAIDLIGSGIDASDTNSITSLAQYVKPLTDFVSNLSEEEKVILVGHDFGGACISYAMELFPSKISKAVFVAATMLTSGQSALDIFSQQEEPNDLMQEAQIFLYAKGNNSPPTAIDLDKSLLKDLLFNHSATKDVALATVSMRPIPFSPVLEKLSLSDTKYGSVRKFYIQTSEDNAIPFSLQERMIAKSPPEQVFCLKGADHSPFFSKPQALHKFLAEISKIQ